MSVTAEPLQQFPVSNDMSQGQQVSTLTEKGNAQDFSGAPQDVGGDGLGSLESLAVKPKMKITMIWRQESEILSKEVNGQCFVGRLIFVGAHFCHFR
jgi:hypothetical protein